MRHSQAEKMEVIRLVVESAVSIRRTLTEFGIARSTFYKWYHRYLEYGYDSLADRKPAPRKFWNKIPQTVKDQVVEIALPLYQSLDGPQLETDWIATVGWQKTF